MPRSRNAVDYPETRRIVTSAVDLIRQSLPPKWSVKVEPLTKRDQGSIDAFLRVRAADGSNGLIIIEAKQSVSPSRLDTVMRQLDAYKGGDKSKSILLVAPFIPRSAREFLREGGWSYLDLTGNARVVLDEPGLFIERSGATSNPWRPSSIPVSVKGPKAGRVVRALADYRRPLGVRELAGIARVSAGYASRLLVLFERNGLVERALPSRDMTQVETEATELRLTERRGPVTKVDWAGLIELWTQSYSLLRTNEARYFLEPRGIDSFLEKLKSASFRYALTGAAAAAVVAPRAAVRLVTCFVDDLSDAARLTELTSVEGTGNVVLLEPFDEVVFARTRGKDTRTYAAMSQVLADLATSPGRPAAEVDALKDWMRRSEAEWRLG